MKSILQSTLMFSMLAAALLAPSAAYAQSCTYGPCDASECGTLGNRFANNQPCIGEPVIACAAPACPACTYGPCDATTCGTTGTRTANNIPCTGATTISCNAPPCPACFYGACSAACGGGSQFSVNQPCDGAPSQACNTQACPTAFYLRSAVGSPWEMSSNEFAMDAAFGVGGWVDDRYETVDPALLFAAESFIFMEGLESKRGITSSRQPFVQSSGIRPSL